MALRSPLFSHMFAWRRGSASITIVKRSEEHHLRGVPRYSGKGNICILMTNVISRGTPMCYLLHCGIRNCFVELNENNEPAFIYCTFGLN